LIFLLFQKEIEVALLLQSVRKHKNSEVENNKRICEQLTIELNEVAKQLRSLLIALSEMLSKKFLSCGLLMVS